MNTDEYLTISQAAKRLGVTPAALRGAIHRKSLNAVRIGPIYLVSPEEADRYKDQAKPGRPKKEQIAE